MYKKRDSFFISNKQGKGIDRKYNDLSNNLLNGNYNGYRIETVNCNKESYLDNKTLQGLFNKKDFQKLNNYYLSLIFFRSQNKLELDHIRKFYFLIK